MKTASTTLSPQEAGPAGSAAAGEAGAAAPGAERLVLRGVTKRFGPDVAVDSISIQVEQGEMFGLLGPSGCGKTTTLRMIAGLEDPDEGQIVLGEKVLADGRSRRIVPPERRNMGMVFQSYATWPHMTVEENVAFPLRLRRRPRAEVKRRVRDILELTGLGHVAKRASGRLSGGQQQRVALARALVYEPSVLLLDEPLSNLDAALREQMRQEIKRLHRELGLTVIFVTHDQEEAMALATRMVVMNHGVVEQLGTPLELYTQPATPFVLDFLGRAVMIPAELHRQGDTYRAHITADGRDHGIALGADQVRAECSPSARQPVWLVCRPEDVSIESTDGVPPQAGRLLPATVGTATYLGDRIEYEVEVAGAACVVSETARRIHPEGSRVTLRLDPDLLTAWPRDGEQR